MASRSQRFWGTKHQTSVFREMHDRMRVQFRVHQTLISSEDLFGEIVEDDEGVFAVIAEELAHGSAGIGRQVLQGSGVGGSGGHNDAVIR